MASSTIGEPRKLGPRKSPTTTRPRANPGGSEVPKTIGPRRAARLAAEAAVANDVELPQDHTAEIPANDVVEIPPGVPRPAAAPEPQTVPATRRAKVITVTPAYDVRPVAGPARARLRHWMVMLSFLLLVLAPLLACGWYLWYRAFDQYASTIAFSVRKEETASTSDLLGGLSQLSGASSTDTDILYNFIQSQELVDSVDHLLNLRQLYAANYDNDPVFSLKPDATIEDLVSYWPRMVKIIYDSGTGLIELRVLAFDPDKAREIATAVFDKSSEMINRLSAIARADTTRYAKEELDLSVERLKAAREATTAFRSRTQIVDPSADIQGQMGLLNTLQAQLASALIDLDLLRESTREGDPRLAPAQSRIAVIQARIDEERKKFGVGGKGPGGEDYATLVAEYERLTVDLEFAEAGYKAALSAYDVALAEAQRKSRYLAAYVSPTLAESAEYPRRMVLMGLAALFLFLFWSVLTLVYYSVRDRR